MTDQNAVDQDWKDLEARFVRATEIKPGITVNTKDGRKIGNGYVIQQDGHTSLVPKVTRDYIPVFLIETDFGNRVRYTLDELNELFYPGFAQPYNEWWNTRYEKIREQVKP